MSRESYVDVEGGCLWTCASGEGPAVVLASGGPGLCDYLEPVAAMLIGARVIRFEQRGCGRSSKAEQYTLEQLMDDLDRVREHYGLNEWSVMGHSWGADVALLHALERPERTTAGLGFAGGKVVDDREWSRVYHERRATVGETLPPFAYAPNQKVNAALNADWRGYCRKPDLLARIARCSVPMWFVSAENDIRPGWPTQQLAGLLPRGEWHSVPGAHAMWLTHPDELASVLCRFIAAQRA